MVTGQISNTTGMSILVSFTPALRNCAAELLARNEFAKDSNELANGVPLASASDNLLENSLTESVGMR